MQTVTALTEPSPLTPLGENDRWVLRRVHRSQHIRRSFAVVHDPKRCELQPVGVRLPKYSAAPHEKLIPLDIPRADPYVRVNLRDYSADRDG